MTWSNTAWAAASHIYDKILKHPFLLALIDGSLEQSKFSFYIRQDAMYLAEFGRALSAIAGRLDNLAHSEAFLGFAKDTMYVERALHESFLSVLPKESTARPSPSCLLYTSYVHRQLLSPSVELALAGILPCFWVYLEVGEYILANQNTASENPCQMWINTYGGEEYAAAVRKCKSICNGYAEKAGSGLQEQMTEVFINGVRMEWMFWDSAWRMEQWPV